MIRQTVVCGGRSLELATVRKRRWGGRRGGGHDELEFDSGAARNVNAALTLVGGNRV